MAATARRLPLKVVHSKPKALRFRFWGTHYALSVATSEPGVVTLGFSGAMLGFSGATLRFSGAPLKRSAATLET